MIMTNPATLINQTSGEVEYYTPPEIISAIRDLFADVIDLDPASSEGGNRIVRASRFFTKEDDGLSKEWNSTTLWMNHPFSRTGNKLWVNKLLHEFAAGNVREACCITYACTSEAWFRPLLDFPQCFLSPRTNYLLPDGTVFRGVTKGSVVTYLGPDKVLFRKCFEGSRLGKVKI